VDKELALPVKIMRKDDREIFSLNEDGKTYSRDKFKKEFPDNLCHKYDYNTLMVNYKQFFEVVKE